ncbi:hypothetical protein M427DRAFT_68762 [Gonapodya prolifera JEL478]|uniref:Nitroreductase domain-containing protein n=1 Tax=Gonapodya prolifera (strain JEL478) TaxID=1344416 RepID=A0A139AKH2_GONPJ|nr:hypothetical protein M427DRAFT_68762 [Gonapodya prolifera JEL478]|eukprot:KXS17034.1 hypothetical protein M427DRAFT_68762 [Gonapodya prolifera JEL478]
MPCQRKKSEFESKVQSTSTWSFPLLNLPAELIIHVGHFATSTRLGFPTGALNKHLVTLFGSATSIATRAENYHASRVGAVLGEIRRLGAVGKAGSTPDSGRPKVIKTLLDRGIPDHEDLDRIFRQAAQSGALQIVQMMVQDYGGIQLISSQPIRQENPLAKAIKERHDAVALYLLSLNHREDSLYAPEDLESALRVAVAKDAKVLVQALVPHLAPFSIVLSQCLFSAAVTKRSPSLVEAIISSARTANYTLHPDCIGDALKRVSVHGNVAVVKVLMENLKDDFMPGTLDRVIGIAEVLGRGEVAKLLKKYLQCELTTTSPSIISTGFKNARVLPLPFPSEPDATPVPASSLIPFYHPPHSKAPAPLTITTLSELLFYSLSVSAWKNGGPGDKGAYALRCNPSSGNLHPVECYVIGKGLDAAATVGNVVGVWHYAPDDHVLEERGTAKEGAELWTKVGQTLDGGPHAEHGLILCALTSVTFREVWKYGIRGWRYCQLDVGHAIACLSLSASLLGWSCRLLHARSLTIGNLVGAHLPDQFVRGEEEEPCCLLAIGPRQVSGTKVTIGSEQDLDSALAELATLVDFGNTGPTELSPTGVRWSYPQIEVVSKLTQREDLTTDPGDLSPAGLIQPPPIVSTLESQTILNPQSAIRIRRSTTEMSTGDGALPLSTFHSLLARTVPHLAWSAEPDAERQQPWSVLSDDFVDVHLVIAVHEVEGLAKGLYLLVRSPLQSSDTPSVLKHFLHANPTLVANAAPLQLYLIKEGYFARVMGGLSCMQDIARDGHFSLAMIGRVPSDEVGTPRYRRVFWEAGMLGQVLYHEATMRGGSATGIGCYFDDAVAGVAGLNGGDGEGTGSGALGGEFQVLYHFSVGVSREDERVRRGDPYSVVKGMDRTAPRQTA